MSYYSVVSLVATGLVLGGALAGPAAADNPRAKSDRGEYGRFYASISPVELATILGGEEGSLKLDDGVEDVTLDGEIDGKFYTIYFYECDGGGFADPARADSECLGFEYRAYFENYTSDSETVNAFNAAHHYGALWRDEDGDLGLQFNVVVEGGITADNIRVTFAWWRAVLKSFDEFMEDR